MTTGETRFIFCASNAHHLDILPGVVGRSPSVLGPGRSLKRPDLDRVRQRKERKILNFGGKSNYALFAN